MEEKIYIRKCPKCSKEVSTKNKYWHLRAIKENRKCGSCGLKGTPKSDAHKLNMSKNHANVSGEKNPFYNKTHSADTIEYLSEIQKKRMEDETLKKKLSDSMVEYHKNYDNGFKGKSHSDESKKIMTDMSIERFEDINERIRISESLKGNIPWNAGKTGVYTEDSLDRMKLSAINRYKNDIHPWLDRIHTNESRKKMRLSAIKYIEEAKLGGGQLIPRYNISSIPILEKHANELEITDLQHAENGGEYFIKELGYWVDGYSKEKNIVIEYYERYHNNIKKKDLQRQKEITEFLNCEFIIIHE